MFGRSIMLGSAVAMATLMFAHVPAKAEEEPSLLSKPERITDPAEMPPAMPPPKPRPQPVLCLPANVGNLAKVQSLLKKGAVIDASDALGRTALMVALSRPEDAALAEERKAKGKPVTDAERNQRKLKVARFLLERGPNIRLRSEIGMSALHYAAMWPGPEQESLDLVRLLLSKGADADARMEAGITPLRLAVDHHHPQVARLLIEAGADPQSKDDQDETPWRSARSSGSVEMMDALRGRTPLPGAAPAAVGAAQNAPVPNGPVAPKGTAPKGAAAPAAAKSGAPQAQ